jgi:hypothetical protein
MVATKHLAMNHLLLKLRVVGRDCRPGENGRGDNDL